MKIYYADASTSSVNLDAEIEVIKPIKYQMEIDPGNQKFRFGRADVVFWNKNDVFETSGVLNSAKKDETFCQILIDGVVFFDGRLLWDQIKKEDWFLDTTLKYRKITLPFEDKLSFLFQKTLADATYTDGMLVETLLNNAAAVLGLTSDINTAYVITEQRGASYGITLSFNTDQLRIWGLNSTDNLMTTIKALALALGHFVYTQDNKFVFVQRDQRSSALLSTDNIIKIEKVRDRSPFDSIEVKATKNWRDDLTTIPAGFPTINTHDKILGTVNAAQSRRNYVLDATGVLNLLYIPTPGTGTNEFVPITAANPTSFIADYSIEYWDGGAPSGRFYLATEYAESGMWVHYNNLSVYSVILDVPSAKQIDFFDVGNIVNTGQTFQVRRHDKLSPDNNYLKLWKVEKCVQKTADILNIWFRTGDPLKIWYNGLWKIENTFSLDGTIYAVGAADYDLRKNTTKMEVRPVA